MLSLRLPRVIILRTISIQRQPSNPPLPRPPWTPTPTLKYPLHPPPLPPPHTPPKGLLDDTIPFRIFRTPKGKQLPVYTDFKNGRTRCMTIVRRYRGDQRMLAEELSRVCDGKVVVMRPGRVEVKGNYSGRVREWLVRLGF